MKAAPVLAELARRDGVRQTLVHTGQHYDHGMSDVFFSELGLPKPDHHLGVGAGRHGAQTGAVMERLEPIVLAERPDWTVVYGDVNSTAAAALVAAKLHVGVAHVEAGLRSGDRGMPEELNRIVTDQLSDLLLTPSEDADANLAREGIPASRIRRVGNVMIDTLVRLLPAALASDALRRLGVAEAPFALVTLHRPANVDDDDKLRAILDSLARIAATLTVLFPVHPRTRARLAARPEDIPGLRLIAPLGYLDFLAAQRAATVVVTDSGGVQEETTFLGVPCLTLRPNTERPITVEVGTNTILDFDLDRLEQEVARAARGEGKRGAIPPLWDGHTAERIADSLLARASTAR